MIFPESGRIVVIDDSEKEGLPLVKALKNKGLTADFFTGRKEKLPKIPLNRVRLVFLDLILSSDYQDIKTEISMLKGILSKIINKTANGPFLLVAWTKHPEKAKEIFNALSGYGFHFIFAVMKKSECQNARKRFVLSKIVKTMESKLNGKESFQVFILWENLVSKSVSNVLDSMFQLESLDDKWNENMRVVIFKLAKSILGEHIKPTKTSEIIENVFYSINSVFLDELRLETKKSSAQKINISFKGMHKKNQNICTDGAINSKLILTKNFTNHPMPGNIYPNRFITKVNIDDLLTAEAFQIKIKKGVFEKDSDQEKIFKNALKHIAIEVTPLCDYAEKKNVKNRIMAGILWPSDKDSMKKYSKPGYTYCSPVIDYDGALYHLIFDYRTFTSLATSKLKGRKPIFMAQNELLSDIQSKLASHVSRLGVIQVSTLKKKN